ncbi:uncharacterized protein [Rutidosis leptorrhynchoides]|uniref:uncharacterized protein n=1 Tax=Rutidosis leptorrhynchoides TaxID=125765 RepID=UPI003A99161E
MSECVARESLQNFTKCIVVLYANDYMCKPTREDMERLYDVHEEKHDIPSMLGSIDCMHWVWEKCPVAWQGQFKRGDHSHPTIMLEAVVSPLFESMLNDNFPDIPYVINGVEYKRGYYLADEIYPQWASFVKAYSSAADPKMKAIQRIMYACIIMHNMIVEDNGFNISENNWVYELVQNMQTTWYDRCEEYKARTKELHDMEVHERLRGDLVEHVWAIRVQEEDEGEE